MTKKLTKKKIVVWQFVFLVTGMSWLLAPSLNHLLSDRTALISQYENTTQAYSWLFRICDVVAGLALVWIAAQYYRLKARQIDAILLFVVGVGMIIDPIFTTTCHVQGKLCVEHISPSFIVHATETVITSFAVFALIAYDAYKRHRLVSYAMLAFEFLYGCLYISGFADTQQFNTLSQYVYESTLIIWLAWYCRDRLWPTHTRPTWRGTFAVRYVAAIWAFLNGLLAILVSLAHIHVIGRIQGLYFAGDNAWLAQHGVFVGVAMLYLSRHIQRGEQRARQIFLALVAIETIKYAVIAPNPLLMAAYWLTFVLLFIAADDFSRGAVAMTWRLRVRDLAFMVIALLGAIAASLVLLDSDDRASIIARHSFKHFQHYALHSDMAEHGHRLSALLADTTTAFIAAAVVAILWILFKPSKVNPQQQDFGQVRAKLQKYSNSTEDYFKLWPQDKDYFWGQRGSGFVAYKIQGPVAFALADPIAPAARRQVLANEFVSWCRSKRLTACFLPVNADSLKDYQDLNKIQIGSSALVGVQEFLGRTAKDKWWRWKLNKATKQGYEYAVARAPHDPVFLQALKAVSDSWLQYGGHQERGFALGYFDEQYLANCDIHYLKDSSGRIIAFVNQLPVFKRTTTQTVDLLRYLPDAQDTMPYLLYKLIGTFDEQGHKKFDLGFVPFAGSTGPVLSIAKLLSAGQFSAKGLEQFKNKFKPDWQPYYLLYDGDLADLAIVALNLERVMKAQ
jgi:lysylphosphatidylglycerol synthetase-like protein (DUF2156 family)